MFDPKQLFQRFSPLDATLYTLERCTELAGILDRIVELKKERNAVILAHNYQRPEIFEIADYTGDSLGLSLQAGEVPSAEVIIFCGVHFMAETAKIVSPGKKVILPNLHAGCSLADTANPLDVINELRRLRSEGGELAVVSYVNTTAEVKSLSDACCTSSNAVEVCRAIPQNRILFIPDQNLARYVQQNLPEKEIIPWNGHCYVHQELEPVDIMKLRIQHPHLKVLVHPECRDDVVRLADAVVSTSGMVTYARESDSDEFLAVTECGLSDLLTIELPDKRFYRACKICRFMKMITAEQVLRSLETLSPEIQLAEDVRSGAEKAIKNMFELTRKPSTVS